MVGTTGTPYAYASDNAANRVDFNGKMTLAVCGQAGLSAGIILGINFGYSSQICLIRTYGTQADEWGISETFSRTTLALGGSAGVSVGYQVSNGNHISAVSGPFKEVAVSGKLGFGVSADYFWGSASNGRRIYGGDFQVNPCPICGIGYSAAVNTTVTYVQEAHNVVLKYALEALWYSLSLPLYLMVRVGPKLIKGAANYSIKYNG